MLSNDIDKIISELAEQMSQEEKIELAGKLSVEIMYRVFNEELPKLISGEQLEALQQSGQAGTFKGASDWLDKYVPELELAPVVEQVAREVKQEFVTSYQEEG